MSDATNDVRHGASVVTIGTYDGVHLGHRQLIAVTRQQADERGVAALVVTFDRHPATVLRPERAPRLLTGLEHKLELLHEAAVDDVVVLRFDHERSLESAEDFVERVLVGELGATAVVVGASFRFGHGHLGDVALLSRLGERFGFEAIGVELLNDEMSGSVISSSRIRALVTAGDLPQAARLLGRDHELRGIAVTRAGAANGALGVVVSGELCLPPRGSYAARFGPIGAAKLSVIVEVEEDPPERPAEMVVGVRAGSGELANGPWPAVGTRCALQLLGPAKDMP